MTWEVDFTIYESPSGAVVEEIAGTVVFHERMYQVLINLMGSISGRDIAKAEALNCRAFSAGTPDPTNDLVSDHGLTIDHTDRTLLQMHGWTSPPTDVSATVPVIDTGSAVEFYGEMNRATLETSETIAGFYIYEPSVDVGGFDTPDWIVAYLIPDSPFDIQFPVTRLSVIVRLKVTVTVPA